MTPTLWRPSDAERRMTTMVEVLGLLHDIGKLSNDFIKRVASDRPMDFWYDYELVADPSVAVSTVSQELPDRLQTILNRAANSKRGAPFKDIAVMTEHLRNQVFQAWDNSQYDLAELILLAARWAVDVDWVPAVSKSMQPAKLVGYLHGIAHYEKEDPEQEKDERGQIQRLNKQPYAQTYAASPFGNEKLISVDEDDKDLSSALKALPLDDINHFLSDHSDLRSNWLMQMRAFMERGLAETQRPTNEVSLWDWGYTTAGLAKAATVFVQLRGWPATLEDIAFRTLSVNLDFLDLYTRSSRISDLLGVRSTLDNSYNNLSSLLEEELGLGNLLYHDETGAYYLIPDGLEEPKIVALREAIQTLFPTDLRPKVNLGKKVKACELDIRSKSYDPEAIRGLVSDPRQRALDAPPVDSKNNLYTFHIEWTEGRPENAEICTVCGVNPVGYPREGTYPEVEESLGRWARQDKAKDRSVCRVCLDRRGRRSADWVHDGLSGTIWTDEVADSNGRLALLTGKLGLENWLDGTMLSSIRVTDTSTKNPSPARLYRIAETARRFWEKVTKEVTPSAIGQRPLRLALYPQPNVLPELGKYHAYELSVDGLALAVVWDPAEGRFLTSENLAYFAHRWQIPEEDLIGRLEGQTVDVLEPSAFLKPGQPLTRITIVGVLQLDGYEPSIPLLAEPSVCMSLVPADRALNLILAIRAEYEAQMGRVRDRLPISLGLVFFDRGTPIRSVLEAGRSMLDMHRGDGWDAWRLTEKDTSDPLACRLVFSNGISWHVPTVVGDGTTQDQWYPRLFVRAASGDPWQNSLPMHVLDLPVADQNPDALIWVRPSYFDFEYLDTTGRRFEIEYGGEGRPICERRPFYLDDLERLLAVWEQMERLAVSQRQQVVRTIETTREAWHGGDKGSRSSRDAVFREFVAHTLAGANWRDGTSWARMEPEMKDDLIEAGATGHLTDLAELHMHILKQLRR